MLQLLLFFLPVVAVLGWWIGYRHKKILINQENNHDTEVSPDYFLGLNYLLHDEPDKAIDVFIKMLEVNSNTVETHLALGNLFRKRGEIERAIRIHQNLIARPQLLAAYRTQALFELAQDYLRAGVLDRAENIFQELLKQGGDAALSLQGLLGIYQQQKDWHQAIVIARKIAKLTHIDVATEVAHYYCELAEQAQTNKLYAKAKEYLQTALTQDKNCARANIILGKLLFSNGDYQQALNVLQKIYAQDVEYVSEVIDILVASYKQLGLEQELVNYLKQRINETGRIYYILAMSDYLSDKQGSIIAVNYLTEQLSRRPSLRGLKRILELYLLQETTNMRSQLVLLKEFLDKLLVNKPVYRCIHCGFAGKNLYWQCPSCRRWNSVKPIHGLEGD